MRPLPSPLLSFQEKEQDIHLSLTLSSLGFAPRSTGSDYSPYGLSILTVSLSELVCFAQLRPSANLLQGDGTRQPPLPNPLLQGEGTK